MSPTEPLDRPETIAAIEAILFASGEPVTTAELKQIFKRLWSDQDAETRDQYLAELPQILVELKQRWNNGDTERGFSLVEVGGGLVFRSDPRFADVLRAMQAQRPMRLSRPALETLSIIAYRQPVTKPEIDHVRGVDCGGTIRLLLDRRLVRIMGKKEEPGRPLIYGTTSDFLSFFNLRSLNHLPTLREFSELSEDALEELQGFDGLIDIDELKPEGPQIRIDSEPSLEALDEAVQGLKETQRDARKALEAEGIKLEKEEEPPPVPADQPDAEATGAPDGTPPTDAQVEPPAEAQPRAEAQQTAETEPSASADADADGDNPPDPAEPV